ncbi:MAG: MBL fold metallo-hydrolase [Myxococcales bacterium]|nr:MBL fold metallo-hydrolase [Myxococcales bacterium]
MTYRIYSIEGNSQRLDGGSMFGNAPHAVWSRWIAPDERMRIPLACRAFLIHDEARDQRILLDAGIGVFFEPKLKDRFGVLEDDHRLLESLAARGVAPDQIDVVIMSHLHFDHAGGLLSAHRDDAPLELVFPRARVIVNQRAWQRATQPHVRDRASFIPALHELLQASGRLELVEAKLDSVGPDLTCTVSDGHTPGLMLARLQTQKGSAVFCADLVPGKPWIHLPITMGYDRFPELLVDEKTPFIERARADGTHLLLTHDPVHASCTVGIDAKKKYCAVDPVESLDGLEL